MVTLLWGLWVTLSMAWAGQVQWVAKVQDLMEGQSVTVQLSIHQGRSRKAPDLAFGRGLDVQYMGSRQTIQSVNMGRLSQVHTYEYRVTAMEQGDWTIGPGVLVLTDGSQAKVDTLTIRVRERVDDPGGLELEAQAGFDRLEAWVGEVVLYQYRAKARASMVDVNWRLPEFEGVRQPSIGSPMERDYVVEDPSGPIAVTEGWWPFVVTSPKTIEVGGALARFSLHSGRVDLFGFSEKKIKQRATAPVQLKVNPLPPAPADYTGLVGEFEFASSLDREDASVGESVTWTIEVIGSGTVEGLELLLPDLEGATLYPGEVESRAVVERGLFTSLARFEHVLVPTQEGRLEPGPMVVSVFSPEAGAYVQKQIAFPPLDVSGGEATSSELTSYGSSQGASVATVVPGMRPPRVRGSLRRVPWERGLPWLWGLLMMPGVFVLGAAVRRRLKERFTKEIKEAVASPKDYLTGLPDDLEGRCARLDAALRCALLHRFDIPGGLNSRERLVGMSESWEGHSDLRELFSDLDRGQYASVTDGSDLEARTVAMIARLEVAS